MSVILRKELSIPQLRQVFGEINASPAVTAAIRNITRNANDANRWRGPMTAMVESSQSGGIPQMTVAHALRRLSQISTAHPAEAKKIRQQLKSELALKQ